MARPKLFAILAIIFLGIIIYSNSFGCSFHFDDEGYIINNYPIRNIRNLIDIWNICPCRFLTFLSLSLNYHFHGLHVFGYHLVNLFIHITTSLLVWWLCQLTFKTPFIKNETISQHADAISLFAALIFVSHPVQIEAVTYIWQRAASMCAMFYLASLCFYIQWRLTQDKTKAYYALSLIFAVFAMFTKENAITLPFIILLYEYIFLKLKKANINWINLYPFWMILFIIPQTMVLTKTARVGEIQTIVNGPNGISPFTYLLTQCRVIMTYLRLLILPIHLNLDYDYPIYTSLLQIPVLASVFVLGGILYFAKTIMNQYKLIAFAIFFFFLTLLPESSILPQTDVIFEHRLYLPLAGYAILLVSGVYHFIIRHSEQSEESKSVLRSFALLRMTVLVLSIIVAVNSILTYERNKMWKDELTLWKDIVAKSPHKARPHINLGWAYYHLGNDTKAMAEYTQAINLSTEFIYPFDDKGLIYARQGKIQNAIAEYNKAITINPYYAQVYYHRGISYEMQKNNQAALTDFNKALELNPEYVDAYNDRGSLYARQSNWESAIADYKSSLHIDPNQRAIKNQLTYVYQHNPIER